MIQAIKKIQDRGIYVIAGMCVGFDSDDMDIFQMQSEFLIDAGLMVCVISLLQAPRGTKLWHRLKKENRLASPFDDGNFYADTNIIPKLMGKEKLEENYVKLMREVFSYPHFLKRLSNFMKQIRLKGPNAEHRDTQLPGGNKFKPDDLTIALRLTKHYLFNKNRKKSKFFLSALIMALKKGPGSLPYLIEFIIWFKSQRDYIDKTYQ